MTAPPPRGCGSIPLSSGPASQIAQLHLSAPTTAAPGGQVTIRATVQVSADGQRIISGPSMSQLLITQHGAVVGKSDAQKADIAVPLTLRAGTTRPAQVLPTSVRMSGCPGGSGDRSSAPLPSGEYAIVAVLGYRLDPLNSGADAPQTGGLFYLVSRPAAITVR